MKNLLKKEVFTVKKQKELKVVAFGSPSVESLTKEEQKNFYITLLARMLELYKQKLNKED